MIFGQIAYSISLETALRTEIFTSYSTAQRPAKQVLVNADLILLTVNDMVRNILRVNSTFTASIVLLLQQNFQ